MVPKEFRKPLVILAGCVTLLEAIVWGAWCIYSIGVLYCAWDFIGVTNGVSTWNLLYITYYMGACRSQKEAADIGFSFNSPSSSANSLQVWMWIHAILSILWIPTCLLLIGTASKEVKGDRGAKLYYPWIGLAVILVFFDFAGTMYHLIDVFQTSSPEGYADFTASTSWSTLTLNSSSENVTTWLPSLFVCFFFCRVAVLWLLNIYFVSMVYKASNSILKFKSQYIQNTSTNTEPKRSWDNPTFKTEEDQPKVTEGLQTPTNINNPNYSRYRTDEFGIPVGEVNSPNYQHQHNETIFDYTGRPVTPNSYNERWPESPPPIASGIKIPPQLETTKPFSYTAGDQPQLIKPNLSRSNSKTNYPHIPRPDYTIAERRAASLQYVPNRFRVPSPKRVQIAQNSFNYDLHSPTSKSAPVPPKKPPVHQRSAPNVQYSSSILEDNEVVPTSRYIRQQSVPANQEQLFRTRQASQNDNYSIDKLF